MGVKLVIPGSASLQPRDSTDIKKSCSGVDFLIVLLTLARPVGLFAVVALAQRNCLRGQGLG